MTVERKTGRYRIQGVDFNLVELLGTYSLDVTDHEVSLDERIARDFVHAREADLILNILDAANLERNLYLTTQLIEMGRPLVVALNMMGVAIRTWERTQGFVFRAGRVIMPMVLVLNVLTSVGTDGTYGNEDSDKAIAGESCTRSRRIFVCLQGVPIGA